MNNQPININVVNESNVGESYFDGGLLSYIGYKILGGLAIFMSLGLLYPWAMKLTYAWKINHTVIKGKRLQFNGTATGLFGHYIKWLILTWITLGIYSFWLFIKLEQWKVKHTTYKN